MRKSFRKRIGILGLLLGMGVVMGCAGLQTPVQISEVKSPLLIKASDFKFEPNNIRLAEPGTLSLKVENISGIAHNITIKNSEGQILANADLPAKATVSLEVNLTGTGVYEIYCDKPFHTSMGMKGQIIVGK
ncbi:MAG TPA: plastocyanin/azurin family copper-binding protein [Thermodesulfobacteriota bacterium]|nr:plastocyanin/azurin family copper-binding protein [Thermodesulfobacteriota bacterium]